MLGCIFRLGLRSGFGYRLFRHRYRQLQLFRTFFCSRFATCGLVAVFVLIGFAFGFTGVHDCLILSYLYSY